MDNFSSCGDLVKLNYKSEVPELIAYIIALYASRGVTIKRLHFDNENCFHSPQARAKTVTTYQPQGILITTSCAYEHNQNSVIERFWRTCANDGRASMSVWGAEEGFLLLAMVDAASKRQVMPLADDRDHCPLSKLTRRKPTARQFKPFGCEVHMRLQHELNDSRTMLDKGCDPIALFVASS